MTKPQLDHATIREIIRIIDESPAVTWVGKGGVRERLEELMEEDLFKQLPQ